MLGVSLGGHCSVPPCKNDKRLRPFTDTLCGLEYWEKILCFGRVLWSRTEYGDGKLEDLTALWLLASLKGCVTVIGNDLELATE